MAYNFLLIDPTYIHRQHLRGIINSNVPDAVIGEAMNTMSARKELSSAERDVIFVEEKLFLPEMMEMIYAQQPQATLVLCGEQEEHLGKPEHIHYLQKPAKRQCSKMLLEKILMEVNDKKFGENDSEFMNQSLSIHHQLGIKFIRFSDIIYLKASNSYTTFYLHNSYKFTASKPINYYEALLKSPYFFRTHKSYLVNMAALEQYPASTTNAALVANGDEVSISRYRMADFMSLLQNFPQEGHRVAM